MLKVLALPSREAPAAIPGPAPSLTDQSEAEPSAGTRPGMIWCRQPNATSGSMCPMIARAITGLGAFALTMQPSGASMRIVESDPALFGIDGPTMHFTPNAVYASQ